MSSRPARRAGGGGLDDDPGDARVGVRALEDVGQLRGWGAVGEYDEVRLDTRAAMTRVFWSAEPADAQPLDPGPSGFEFVVLDNEAPGRPTQVWRQPRDHRRRGRSADREPARAGMRQR